MTTSELSPVQFDAAPQKYDAPSTIDIPLVELQEAAANFNTAPTDASSTPDVHDRLAALNTLQDELLAAHPNDFRLRKLIFSSRVMAAALRKHARSHDELHAHIDTHSSELTLHATSIESLRQERRVTTHLGESALVPALFAPSASASGMDTLAY